MHKTYFDHSLKINTEINPEVPKIIYKRINLYDEKNIDISTDYSSWFFKSES